MISGWGRTESALDETLIIKYVADATTPRTADVSRTCGRPPGQVDIPAVDVVNLDVADSVMDAELAGRPGSRC